MDIDIKKLCDEIRQTAYEIHAYHGNGHLEKVYENALVHRLRKAGFRVAQQHPIHVYDEDGTPIGDYIADLLVEGEIIVELKTAKSIASEHIAQIFGYLKSSRKRHGLLINFGGRRFQIKKYAWDPDYGRGAETGGGIVSSVVFALFSFGSMFFR